MSKRQHSVSINREKMKNLRIKKGLTQRYVGEIIGYSQARITQFETGSDGGTGIPLDALIGIAKVLEVDSEDLLEGKK